MALTPVAMHIEKLAAHLRLDARTLRRAVEIGEPRRAFLLELAAHIEAIAAELAPEVPALGSTIHKEG
jgi:hypothetical protein